MTEPTPDPVAEPPVADLSGHPLDDVEDDELDESLFQQLGGPQ